MDSHAIATLRYIRASMDAAASINVPGSAAIAVGCVGVLATLVCSIASAAAYWLVIWLGAAVIAASIGIALVLQQFAQLGAGSVLRRAPVQKLLMCWTPALIAGAVLTAVHFAAGNIDAIAGTWLLLYGCAMVSAGAVTTRSIAVLGIAFATLGLLAFVAPATTHIALLGLGFGAFHLIFGFFIRRIPHERES